MLYAVEKNVNAFVTYVVVLSPAPRLTVLSLQERRDNEWGSRVTIVYGDMRTVELPEKVDILVTELLGSFGDNELSPECLDGAMRFLKRASYRKFRISVLTKYYSGRDLHTGIVHCASRTLVVLETLYRS